MEHSEVRPWKTHRHSAVRACTSGLCYCRRQTCVLCVSWACPAGPAYGKRPFSKLQLQASDQYTVLGSTHQHASKALKVLLGALVWPIGPPKACRPSCFTAVKPKFGCTASSIVGSIQCKEPPNK